MNKKLIWYRFSIVYSLAGLIICCFFSCTQRSINKNNGKESGNTSSILQDTLLKNSLLELAKQNKLIGYWPLNGNLFDVTGNYGEGTYHQNPRFEVDTVPLTFTNDASYGRAIDLRGDGIEIMPYIKTRLAFTNDSVKTFSVFVKTTDFEHEQVWIGSGAPDKTGAFDNRAYLGTIGHKVFVGAGKYFHNVKRSYPYPVQDSVWHHYAVVLGNGKFEVYQDGKLLQLTSTGNMEYPYEGTIASSDSLGFYGTSRGFLIGMGGGQRNHPANAIIDDVAVFDKKLTQSEIKAIAEKGSVIKWLTGIQD